MVIKDKLLVVYPSVLKHVPEVISFFILKRYAAYILKIIKYIPLLTELVTLLNGNMTGM